MMRLDKFISESTPHSRKEIRKLVNSGAVEVNRVLAKSPDQKVDETDEVRIHGNLILFQKFIYLMLNKPQGFLSATEDKKDPVVVDLIPEIWSHYKPFPVGRLDKDTEGLLILTNDGQFDHQMTSPKKNVFKRYFAILDQPAELSDVEEFRAGIKLSDFTAKPALLEICPDPCHVYIEIAEGKFHQVKRMCEKVGKTVLFLKRVAIGSLSLDESLPLGKMRELTPQELSSLQQGQQGR